MASNGNGSVTIEAEAPGAVVLERLKIGRVTIPVQGVTPVIPHRWSEKARRMMLNKQQGKAVKKHAPKSPEDEANDSMYWLDGNQSAMPATAFKAAIADAARHFEGITMVAVKQTVFVVGEGPDQLVAIHGDRQLREDTPRNSNGIADLRYRWQVFPWTADLEVEYVESSVTPDALVALVDAAGLGGVGDWRPSAPKSKTGTFGRWRVAS